ncbi:MAG: electron transport complex subunit RsxA [Clostridia bacterium]|nr:electron transport complex subunit RsxA [Clostridia bacterium]
MIFDILTIFLSVALVGNYVFSQTLGICPFLGVSSSPSTALGMGLAVTFVMTLSNAATYLIFDLLLRDRFEYLQTVVFILVIASLVQLIEMMLKKLLPTLYRSLGIYLPLITTNCAVLAAANNAVSDESINGSFLFSTFYGFSAAIGFTIAIVIFSGVRARIDEEDVPKPFRGTPITLICAGIVAMIFNGLLSGIRF